MYRLLQIIRYGKKQVSTKLKHVKEQAKEQLKQSSKTINKMAEKIEQMKDTLANSSPRSFGLLFILSSLPSFYFIKKLLECQYESPAFNEYVNQTLKYYHFKNSLFIGLTLVLTSTNFINPASKFILPKPNATKMIIPLIFTLAGVLLPSHLHSKWVVVPALGADISLLPIEATITNQGVLPFWYFNAKYYLHFFDLLTFVICYRALSNQKAYFKERMLI